MGCLLGETTLANIESMSKIGVLTSGGDAPGMNAAIRSVVRMAADFAWEVLGIRRGYRGLMDGDIGGLGPRAVSNIVQRGGTVLKTSRSEEFTTQEGLERAREELDKQKLDALVIIGGNGTMRGARALSQRWSGGVVVVPATIDNDIPGTDESIGYDTAVNTALEAIDRIRDTAHAHERLFLVEVMGRNAGFIALQVGTAGGAEEIVVPEAAGDLEACCRRLNEANESGKAQSILVVAEGGVHGGAFELAQSIQKRTGFEPRVTVLGHIQRGGRPTARDRVLATKLGAYAVECLTKGISGVVVGEIKGELTTTSFEKACALRKELDPFLLKLIPILAR